MTVFERLTIKIKKDLDLDVENMRRTYVGCMQKPHGAFVWRCDEVGRNYEYGSADTASSLLKAKKLTITSGWGFGESEICEDV